MDLVAELEVEQMESLKVVVVVDFVTELEVKQMELAKEREPVVEVDLVAEQ